MQSFDFNSNKLISNYPSNFSQIPQFQQNFQSVNAGFSADSYFGLPENRMSSFEQALSGIQLSKANSSANPSSEKVSYSDQQSYEKSLEAQKPFEREEAAKSVKEDRFESGEEEKIAEKEIDKSEKSRKTDAQADEIDLDSQYLILSSLAQENPAEMPGEKSLTGENPSFFAEKIDFEGEIDANIISASEIAGSKEEVALSDEEIKWLFKRESGKKLDDLENLIENASEYGIEETDAENLLKAQSLAVSEPKKFLEDAKNFDFENNGDFGFAAESGDLNSLVLQNDFGSGSLSFAHSKAIDGEGKSSKPKITVKDFRTGKTNGSFENAAIQGRNAKAESGKKLSFELNQNAADFSKNSVTFELSAQANASQNILSTSSQAAGANGSNFQSMLSNTIHANAQEFVKAGTIVLKDNNKGSINLILHPEALGNVKVSLSLDEKVVSAQITVQSQDAMNAFKENLESLKQAFQAQGFETAEFNLNFENSGFAGNSGNSSNDNASDNSFFQKFNAEKGYADYISVNSDEKTAENYYEEYGINIVA